MILSAVLFRPIKKDLNHLLQLERPAATPEYVLLDFANEPLISAGRRAAANPVAVFLKWLALKGGVAKINIDAPTGVVEGADRNAR